MKRLTDEEKYELRQEYAAEIHAERLARRGARGGCPDRMCGADDCPRCHPENFKDGVYREGDK